EAAHHGYRIVHQHHGREHDAIADEQTVGSGVDERAKADEATVGHTNRTEIREGSTAWGGNARAGDLGQATGGDSIEADEAIVATGCERRGVPRSDADRRAEDREDVCVRGEIPSTNEPRERAPTPSEHAVDVHPGRAKDYAAPGRHRWQPHGGQATAAR